MIKRFSEDEIQTLREKYIKDPSVVNSLKKRAKLIFEHDINVQKSGKASWNHYFYCKEHSKRLEWDINSPKKYKCPVDGKIFTGEPYEGAWWCKLNDYNIEFVKLGPLIWLITQKDEDKPYLEKAAQIILEYANNFENYEATGGIPDNENNLGKIGGQTLYDAIYLEPLVKGYDILKEHITQEQRDIVENKLIIPLVEHLMKQHVQHLHNHEIKACAGIGMAGIVIDKPDFIEYALHHKYAILDNIERGFSDDNLWFENSTFYHLYTITGLLAFESFAHRTKWSLKNNEKFYKAIVSPINFLLPCGELVMINDMTPGQEVLQHAGNYEFCNFLFPNDDKIIFILNLIYKNFERNSTEAFMYGPKEIPKYKRDYVAELKSQNFPSNGLRFYRFSTKNQDRKTMVFNYSKYSGEHNHHDPLSLIIYGYNEEIMPDIGTTGYGSPMHRGYYKNTAIHNTISIEGSNQPARDPELLEDQIINEKEIQTIAQVDFSKSTQFLDSDFNLEWDENIYKDVKITRYVNWTPTYYVEVTNVKNPHGKRVQWNAIFDGKLKEKFGEDINLNQKNNPYQYLKNTQTNNLKNFKTMIVGKNSELQILAKTKNDVTNNFSDTPANPANRMIKHLMRETSNEDVWYATIFEHRLEDHHESDDFTFNVTDDTVLIKVLGKKEHEIKFKKY